MAASVAGASHVARGEPCQDAHGAAVCAGGTLALAVADGAGSAPLGALGAELAVRAVLAAIRLDVSGPDVGTPGLAHRLRIAALAARAALVDEAADRGVPLRDLACTLTVSLVDADRAAVLQVGDGLAVLRVAMDYAAEPVLAVAPERGQHANETTFLTSDGALLRPAIAELAVSVDAVALSTDGLLRLALDVRAQAPHGAFFAPVFAFAARAGEGGAEALGAFLSSARIRDRTDDDVTLALAVRAPAPPP